MSFSREALVFATAVVLLLVVFPTLGVVLIRATVVVVVLFLRVTVVVVVVATPVSTPVLLVVVSCRFTSSCIATRSSFWFFGVRAAVIAVVIVLHCYRVCLLTN